MANVDCSSCEELREKSIEFATKGVTDTVCNSLKNDTGFSTKNSNDDCEDLDNANDCLIGMMDNEIEKYEACDWQKFMHKFIPNLHQLLKAMICAICGIWTNIHNLWKEIEKLWEHMTQAEDDIDNLEDRMDVAESDIDTLKGEDDRIDCIINAMSSGYDFSIGETPSRDGYLVAGKGVTFLTRNVEQIYSANANLTYVGGGLVIFTGSMQFFTENFTDNGSCYNFDNGSTMSRSASRQGNSVWGQTMYNTVPGNELILEARINVANHPEIDQFFTGFGELTDTGAAQIYVGVYTEGQYAPGQHGNCNKNTGAPISASADAGHLVERGWIYIQMRASYIIGIVPSGQTSTDASPKCFLGVRFNTEEIAC